MKEKLLSKKIFIVQILMSAISFLIPLFPTMYSEDSKAIVPIKGYSSFVFLNDTKSGYLYYGTVAFTIYLAIMGVLFVFGLLSLFMPKEREKGDKRVALLFLILSLIDSIAIMVFYSMIKDMNLHLNIGSILLLVYSVIFLAVYIVLFLLEKKKTNKD